MKKFEATGSLASRQRSGRTSTAAAVARQWSKRCNPCRWLLHMGSAVLEKFEATGVSYGSVWKALRITLKRYPCKLQHKQN
ncbi:hypothetical protein CEXT_242451 [Caerostris extrusa]|uniref:Transposase n=1 Tax=Caerostris extrusa TaxID=172846 RepID=A0AAV4VD37_CAEEX|nr:hypothetical protein CEXT_242451 [Caerostris extrusa]